MTKIGLALGGGGARGGAHLGALQELEKLGLQPQLVTGTSIGALVAALYAAGVSLSEIIRFFRNFSFGSLYALPGSGPSLSSVTKFTPLLAELMGRPTFDQLQRSLAVVATNLVTKKEVVLDEGDVVTAVLASMAFPILLPPVERDGLILVDGGLVNNVPFDVARARGANFVIAIDLGNAAPYGSRHDISANPSTLIERALYATKQRPLYQVMTAVTDIITHRVVNARMAISPPDVLLRPEIGTIGLLDFQELDKAMEVGREAVRQQEAEIRNKLKQVSIS